MSKPVVLLLGAGGLLGRDLVKVRQSFKLTLVACRSDVDVTQKKSLEDVFEKYKPEVVINCVALSAVDKAETDPALAESLNVTGPRYLAELCDKSNSLLIHLSTDYVYSEVGERPFVETDPTHPINQYGKSKVAGEHEVQKWKKHYILRTSSLFGLSRMNHALRVIESIKTKEIFSVTTDTICSPTYTAQLAYWIYEMIFKQPDYGIYHLVNKGHVSRYEFARALCEKWGAEKPFPIREEQIKKLSLPAQRPLTPLLDVGKWEKAVHQLPSWQEGLDAFLDEYKRTVK